MSDTLIEIPDEVLNLEEYKKGNFNNKEIILKPKEDVLNLILDLYKNALKRYIRLNEENKNEKIDELKDEINHYNIYIKELYENIDKIFLIKLDYIKLFNEYITIGANSSYKMKIGNELFKGDISEYIKFMIDNYDMIFINPEFFKEVMKDI